MYFAAKLILLSEITVKKIKMKANIFRKSVFYSCVLVCMFVFVSCEKSNNEPDPNSNNSYVNNWILRYMKHYYYWNSHIPANPNMVQNPNNFFYSILYKYSQLDGDRFSWIQENYVDLLESLSGVNSGDTGFEYVLYKFRNSDDVYGEVLYVKPNTTAYSQGVKRGNVFYKIDNTVLNISNYQSQFNKEAFTVTFAEPVFYGNEMSYDNERDIAITRTRYVENPVFLDSIYEINGKKTGYLVYNFFASDNGDESYMYDKQINTVFGKFKAAGIENLVVDLRYNSGGSVLSAAHIASMIVNPLNTGNVFYTLKYNRNFPLNNEYFKNRIYNTDVEINNVGNSLQKVCFITSDWSASASEMLVNGLKPFMADKIIVVGDTTVGKSFASISFYEENDPKNKWGMQPLVAMFTNTNGQAVPATGFIPDYVLEESAVRIKKQLGDTNEDLLKAALGIISGQIPTRKATVSPKRDVINTSVNKKAYSNQAVLKDMN